MSCIVNREITFLAENYIKADFSANLVKSISAIIEEQRLNNSVQRQPATCHLSKHLHFGWENVTVALILLFSQNR